MGGGLGLFSASQYRLVTERSRVAMPEVTIGLFPDAGASWILKGLPAAFGAWLGMTGTHMMAADALHIGLGTHAIPATGWSQLVENLSDVQWRGSTADKREHRVRDRPRADALPWRKARWPLTRRYCDSAIPALPKTLNETVSRLTELSGRDDWIDKGLATMRSGCPTSVGIVHEQLRRVRADVAGGYVSNGTEHCQSLRAQSGFRRRCPCADHRQGQQTRVAIRVRWQDLPHDYVAAHFDSLWPTHPLADLGEQ